jgi:SDR family mycofactocin-dependent oxidoreductase
MSAGLQGKVALITGAARGQGRAHALHLASLGADLALVDICGDVAGVPYPLATPEDLDATASSAAALGRRVLTFRADVRDAAAMEAAAAAAAEDLGGIDVVVANAGVFAASKAEDTTPEAWEALLSVNLTGAWITARAAIPHLRARGGGALVFIASVAALKGIEHLAAYGAAKHGVLGLMKTLAVELAPAGIRVNAVCPTNVDTTILHNPHTYALFAPETAEPHPERLAEAFGSVNTMPVPWIAADDVAAAVGWLVSDDARFVTGIALPVDAGALLR